MKTLVSASFCLATIAPVAAAPVMMQKPAVQISGEADVVQIRHKKRGFHRHQDQGFYNGQPGVRQQRRGYRQHNGLWYPQEAFSFGDVISETNRRGLQVRPGNIHPQHVGWCNNKYRSYSARTNSFQPFQGPRRKCRSPFN